MDAGGFPIFFGLVLVVMLVAGAVAIVRGRAARRALEEFAVQRGWGFAPRDDSLVRSFPQVEPFGQGSGRVASNVLRYRTAAGTGYSFDYQYTIHSGSGEDNSSTTYRFHVVSRDLAQPLPRLTLRPEGVMDGIAKRFGVREVQFEHEEFNREWFVQTQHLAAAHDIIHPRMMEWLMTQRGARFVIEGSTLYTYVKGRQKLENIDSLLALLGGFVDQIPPFVWQKAQGEYPQPERSRGSFGLFD